MTIENATTEADVETHPASAPGGWKRVVLGLAVGLIAGAVLALLLPREPRHDVRENGSLVGSGDLDAPKQ